MQTPTRDVNLMVQSIPATFSLVNVRRRLSGTLLEAALYGDTCCLKNQY